MRGGVSLFRRLAGVWLLCAAVAAGPAAAQNLDQVAPKPAPGPSGPPPAIVGPPMETQMLGAEDQQVLEQLKGLVLVDVPAKIVMNGVATPGITIENLPLADAPELRAELAMFLGKPLTFGGMRQITQIIAAWYAVHNHPFVDVVFPAQDIDSGVVQAVVTEFHLGQLRAEGNRWFSTPLLESYVRTQPGDAIDVAKLNEDLALLNQNPFRKVTIVAEKSATEGDTDLILRTEDRLPLRVYAGYDTTGTAALGYDLWNLGINWGNAFGLDQQLSYQFTSSSSFWAHLFGNNQPAAMEAHTVSWLIPLPWRDKLSLLGNFTQTAPRAGPDLGLTGVSGQASGRYILTLPGFDLPFLGAGTHVGEDVQLGYDFKSTNNNLSFGGVEVSNVTTEVDQFPVTYDLALDHLFGQAVISNNFVYSPGGLTPLNKTALFQEQANSPYAAANYVYDTLTVTETTRLPFNASWVMRVTGQLADHNLLPTEQLGLGGETSVRGYHERTANGSEGVILSQELRSPPFSPLARFVPPEFADQLQLLVFWDYGSVRDVHVTQGTPASIELSGAGGGLRYAVSRFLSVSVDYGRELLRPPGGKALTDVLHVSVTVGN